VIVPLPDKCTVTTATMTSPATATGRSIVSEDALEVRAVVPPRRTIDPSCVPGAGELNSSSETHAARAGEADAPPSALAPSTARQMAIGVNRGRRPNMAPASAKRLAICKGSPSFWVTPGFSS